MTRERYFVDLDRWGNRWIYTPWWMVRFDVAKRRNVLPPETLEPGHVYEGDVSVGPIGGGIGLGGHRSTARDVLRHVTRGRPIRVRGTGEMTGWPLNDGNLAVFEADPGATIYIDPKMAARSLERVSVPTSLWVFDRDNWALPDLPVAACWNGQPVAIVMPVRYRQRQARAAA